MATQVDLGKIRPIWKGDWAASTAYEQNDMVKEGVDSYICTAAHTSGSTFADTNWDILAVGAEIPSQSGNSGDFLTTNGSSLSWGTVAQKVLQTVTATASAVTSSSVAVGNYSGGSIPNVGAAHISVNITPVSSTSKLVIMANAPCGTGNNGLGAVGVFVDGTCRGLFSTSGYSTDGSGATVSCFAQNSSTSQRNVQFRALGEWSGSEVRLGHLRNGHSISFDGIYGTLVVMEVE